MNDTSKLVPGATDIIPPGSLSLSDLANRVNYEHKQLKECVIKGAQHAVKAGQFLWQVKRAMRHGDFMDWVAENCHFSQSTANTYMRVADLLPALANSQGIANLTLTRAIKMISDLRNHDDPSIKNPRSTGKRADKVAEAIKRDPLAVLDRAWEEAQPQERDFFLSKVGAAINRR